ncbi:MAG: hypothetical protein HY521_08815 [Proteobacteria bacterium]|nr:hypothetical protein [Pseudomonadota bacterium]
MSRLGTLGAALAALLLAACAGPDGVPGPSVDDDALDRLATSLLGPADTDSVRLLRAYGIVGGLARYGARTIGEHKDSDSVQAIADAVVLKDRLERARKLFARYRDELERARGASPEQRILTHFPDYARTIAVFQAREEILRVAKAAITPRWREVRALGGTLIAGGTRGLLSARGDLIEEIGNVYKTSTLAAALFRDIRFCVGKANKIETRAPLGDDETRRATVCPSFEEAWGATDALVATSIASLATTAEID